MAEKIESKLTGQLCEALLTLKKKSEMQNFLEDICTISEYQSLAQRFEVARMLHSGDKYEEIVKKTGASTATISRVKRCLVYGKDGYIVVLDKMFGASVEPRSAKVARKVKFQKERAARKKAIQKGDLTLTTVRKT